MSSIFVPHIDEQFVSDAWNTLDPKPSARDIAELWVDQQANRALSEAEFEQCVKDFIPAVEWYLPENGEAA